MLRILQKYVGLFVPVVILGVMLTWRIFDPLNVLEDFRFKVFDYFQRFEPRKYEPVPVRIVDIDDESLTRYGQWPWSRTVVAELVEKLTEIGAAVIAFDIVFAEPDRTSPSQIASKLPTTDEGAQARETLLKLPDPDQVLADTMTETGNVVTGFVLVQEEIGRPPTVRGNFALAGDDPSGIMPIYYGTVPTLEILEKAAAGNGSFNMVVERDQVVRRVPLALCLYDGKPEEPCPPGKRIYPGLAAEAIRVAQRIKTAKIRASGATGGSGRGIYGDVKTGISSIQIGEFEIPTDPKGQVWLHYTKDVPERYVPAWKVLNGTADSNLLEGALVFVGTSAAGLKDLRVSPLNSSMAGVEAHAQAAEQIILGHYLERPDLADGIEFVFMAVFGVVLIVMIQRLGAGWGATVAFASIAGAFGASWYGYSALRWLTDPVTPAATVLAVFLSGTIINYLRTEAEKKQVRGAFAQYLSPALVEQLAANPDKLKLGGETKNMTFLFCDVRGFTTISEQFKTNPQGLTKLMNRFLTPLTDVILARQGTIDKYMGDCIMAFWNAPLDVPKHPCRAADSALNMFKEIEKLNLDLKAEAEAENRPFYAINIGIGLNSGDVVVGNMGSTQRFDYSVLGDAVNLASRLEGQSKTYGVGVVIGDTTWQVCKDEFATIELDLIAVKGKKEAVRIHALLGDLAMRNSPEFQAVAARHADFLVAYRAQKWEEAEALMQQNREAAPYLNDLYDLYEERIADYRSIPPPEQWDGVYVATSK